MDVYRVSHEAAGFLSSLLTLFAMICTPLFGLFADRVGRRATLMCFGSLLLIPVYLIMAYTCSPALAGVVVPCACGGRAAGGNGGLMGCGLSRLSPPSCGPR